MKGSIVDILRGDYGWSGTMGVRGRGVFEAEFADSAGGAEADEVESREFKIESKTWERNLRTRVAKGAAWIRRTKVIGVVSACAQS